MDYNYHTHTFRCRHASGTAEAYILRAIENGIRHMGFSEHIPHAFPDGFESGHRMLTAEVGNYFAELAALREKYKDRIDLKIGFEIEYYPTYFHEMLQNSLDWGAEYLILGQHYLYDEHPNGCYAGAPTDDVERLAEYVRCVVTAMESGVITYLAHPDLIPFTGDPDVYRSAMRTVCEAAIRLDVPLELNFYGIRDYRKYPNDAFWAIAGETKAPVTFGFDSHDLPSAYDAASLAVAKAMTQRHQLNYIGMPKLRLLQEQKR